MGGDEPQPEAESGRGERRRRIKKTPTRSEKQLRLSAALHTVRIFLPCRSKAPHHALKIQTKAVPP